MGRLLDKVALITGGASGLGEAMVRAFVREGAKVVFSDIQSDRGAKLAAETGAIFVKHDVASEAEWKAVMQMIEDRHGRLDIMVNNAGIVGGTNIAEISLETWNRLLTVNLTGVMLGCQNAVNMMKRNPGGSSGAIVNISSNVGIVGSSHDVAYCASKGGVTVLTKSVSLYCALQKLNIRCNSIHPGATLTSIFDRYTEGASDPEAALDFVRNMSPLGRMGRPEEIAMTAVFLASDEAPFATGAGFVVDGAASSSLYEGW